MARVTSKLQVTIPKALAERYRIRPGTEIDWLPAGEAIRVVPRTAVSRSPDRGRRLELFDAATERQRGRDSSRSQPDARPVRGWRREDLYEAARGLAD